MSRNFLDINKLWKDFSSEEQNTSNTKKSESFLDSELNINRNHKYTPQDAEQIIQIMILLFKVLSVL